MRLYLVSYMCLCHTIITIAISLLYLLAIRAIGYNAPIDP